MGNSNAEVAALKEEQDQFRKLVDTFEKEADNNRLSEVKPFFTQGRIEAPGKRKKRAIFKVDFLLNPDLYLPEAVKNEPTS